MSRNVYDAIVIGAGMGGMTVGSLLARDGNRVLLLEAAHVPGGCSSSFNRKGYIFESGATTLIGFDEHQPLRYLEQELNIRLPRRELHPSMSVWMNSNKGAPITRHKSIEKWIKEAQRYFGNPKGQREFWTLAKQISDLVWKASSRTPYFPPVQWRDWWELLRQNDLRDTWMLPYALKTTADVARDLEVDNSLFSDFLDEQLMITAQATAEETPFIVGAVGLTYTNYSNFYVPGGLLELVRTLQRYIEKQQGELRVKERVTDIQKGRKEYGIRTTKGIYQAPVVISNVPVWNLAEITRGSMEIYFMEQATKYDRSVGALTFGIAMEDIFEPDLTLHHQIHIPASARPEEMESKSLFVSLSAPDDHHRAPSGKRVLNISTHTDNEFWFGLNGQYQTRKAQLAHQIIHLLDEYWDPFEKNKINSYYSATPVTWEQWVYRYRGRVGGIPQWKGRLITDWPTNAPPFDGFYLCGDTVYPGQGIPGVTLSGINAYKRIKQKYS
ncbi:MAG: phytoene desaturase family protein [Bacteroidota bacterium]